VQIPAFLMRQVLIKATPGLMVAPSGMVTSLTNFIRSQFGFGVTVGVTVHVGVMVGVKVNVGEDVAVFVGVSVGVKVGVGV
jgi:hypothetical protein